LADITMPQLGETVTEGTITRWLKQVGEPVAEDEVIFEVSTDKVDSEVPSPTSGYLAEILVPEGETVDVGTRLAVITAEAPAGAVGGGGTPTAETPAPEAPAAAPEPEPAAAPAPKPEAPPARAAEPQPQQEPQQEPEQEPDLEPARLPQPEPRPTPVGPRASAPGAVGPTSPAGARGTRPPDDRPPSGPGGGGPSKVLSPVVRRLIAEHNLDPNQIRGSGAGGRITRADVLALIDRQGATAGNGETATPTTEPAPPQPSPPPQPSRPPQPAPTAAAPQAPPTAAAGERDTIVPFTNIRRRTAEHMVRSKATSAHTVVAMEVDYSGVEKVRLANKARFKEVEGFGLTYLPFISRAVIDAIEEWPHINSSVGDDQLIVHNYLNLGIAVDLNHEGLLVPVIHDADTKRLRALAREVSSLAQRARAKRLTMDDISGGTFTITNAGPFGTLFTIPVINQPQVAILATDGVRKKPVALELPDGTDSIAIHPIGNLVLAFDHRAFDGAYASIFMGRLKEIIETRDWSAEL
jgi:pyruvate dehydrogenase E2 component (dihydrolipoamide acetyltransferase)